MIRKLGTAAFVRAVLVPALFVPAVLVPDAFAQQQVDERRPASDDAQVAIDNVAGSLTVAGWSRQEVEVTGTLGKGIEGLEVTGGRERLRIEVKYPKDGTHRDTGDADLTIHVPHGSRLSINTVSARIDLSELDGEAVLQSVSGAIQVSCSPRVLEISTVSSTVTLASETPLPGAQVRTVSGEIRIDGDLDPGGRFKLETVSGGVTIEVPPSASAEFELSSFSGTISSDFGQQAKKTSEYTSSTELEFTLGGGGARVSVSTLSGRIQVRRS